MCFTERGLPRERPTDERRIATPALTGCLGSDAVPTSQAVFAARAQTHHAAFALDSDHPRRAELGGVADDGIELVPLADPLEIA